MVAIIRHLRAPDATNAAPYREQEWPRLQAIPRELPKPQLVVNPVKVTINPFPQRPITYTGWAKRPFEIIVRTVCDLWNISRNDLLSEKHSWRYAHPRQAAYLLASEFSLSSIAGIGRFFGRDHTTVLYGIEAARKRPGRDYQETLDEARRIVGNVLK